MSSKPFPFLSGSSTELNSKNWLVLVSSVFAGFIFLEIAATYFPERFQPLGIVVFLGLPLLALRLTAKSDWLLFFRRPTLREVGLGVGFGVLNIVVSLVLGAIVVRVQGQPDGNPAFEKLAEMTGLETFKFFALTFPQLIGEELFSVVPFLAVLFFMGWKSDKPRRPMVIAAVFLTALLFAAVHLPTYNWNWIQCFVVIGSARVMLLLPFLITRNLIPSCIAHIFTDWTLFAIFLLTMDLQS